MALSKAVYELEWRTFGSYTETSGGWLVPDSSAPYTPRSYSPAEEPGLVSAVAHLCPSKEADNHRRDVLDFLRDFGCLGQTNLANQHLKIEHQFFDGDSRPWLVRHGRAVTRIMSMHEAQENGDKARLRKLLYQMYNFQKKFRRTFLPAGDRSVSVELPLQDYEAQPEATAQLVIEAIFNLNLGGVDRAVSGGRDVFKFKALVQLVYWRLRDELVAARPIRQCAGCRRRFFVYDARQKFCSPPPFAKESRCAVKQRVLRYRSKSESIGKSKD